MALVFIFAFYPLIPWKGMYQYRATHSSFIFPFNYISERKPSYFEAARSHHNPACTYSGNRVTKGAMWPKERNFDYEWLSWDLAACELFEAIEFEIISVQNKIHSTI